MTNDDWTAPCRCGSGMLRLFSVHGVPCCRVCQGWTLFQSDAKAWRDMDRQRPVSNVRRVRPVRRVRDLVHA